MVTVGVHPLSNQCCCIPHSPFNASLQEPAPSWAVLVQRGGGGCPLRVHRVSHLTNFSRKWSTGGGVMAECGGPVGRAPTQTTKHRPPIPILHAASLPTHPMPRHCACRLGLLPAPALHACQPSQGLNQHGVPSMPCHPSPTSPTLLMLSLLPQEWHGNPSCLPRLPTQHSLCKCTGV